MSKSIGDKSNGGAGEDIAMTLAAIAYETGYDAITNLLNVHAPDWKCVWWPDKEVNGNYAYIAYNGAQYIVAVRGLRSGRLDLPIQLHKTQDLAWRFLRAGRSYQPGHDRSGKKDTNTHA
jgi:hypothetical protein